MPGWLAPVGIRAWHQVTELFFNRRCWLAQGIVQGIGYWRVKARSGRRAALEHGRVFIDNRQYCVFDQQGVNGLVHFAKIFRHALMQHLVDFRNDGLIGLQAFQAIGDGVAHHTGADRNGADVNFTIGQVRHTASELE